MNDASRQGRGPSLRRDVTTGAWSVISPSRASRPRAVPGRGLAVVPSETCPFCPGREHLTGPAIVAPKDDGGWRARAVPNRFPAVGIGDDVRAWAEGPYDAMSGFGAHEVIIESRAHAPALWHQDPSQARLALRLVRDRLADLRRDRRFAYMTWFRNSGVDAGASQAHPHSQVVALPIVPERVERMMMRASRHLQQRGRSLYQDLVEHELRAKTRVVGRRASAVSLCPYAPAADAEVWVLPMVAQSRLRDADDAVLAEVCDLLGDAYRGIERVLGPVATTLTLYTAPEGGESAGFRWHLRLQPRRTPLGGLELGTGTAMVSLAPEQAATLLREASG